MYYLKIYKKMDVQKIYKYLVIIMLLFVVFLTCCEKEITVDLPRPEEKLNVEGSIDLDEYAIVFLTKNLPYFDDIDTTYVDNLIISGTAAIVTVSCGGIVDTLVPKNNFPIWPYRGYIGTKIKGEIGKSYRLDINWDNKNYFAVTTIKDTVSIDSVQANKVVYDELSKKSIYLNAYWKNSPQPAYFMLLLKQPSQKWYFRPLMGGGLMDNKMVASNSPIVCPLTKSYERNSFFPSKPDDNDSIKFADKLLFEINDTISLKLSTIDDDAYLFWSSWNRNQMTDGNPFMNPASVKSNIKGDKANGSWIGYGVTKKSYVILKNPIDTTKVNAIQIIF